jgi:hypothetical protein
MPEEKRDLTKEDPSASLQSSLPAMARHSRTGRLEKAKKLMGELEKLELSEEELEKLVSVAGDSEKLYIFGGYNGRPLNE